MNLKFTPEAIGDSIRIREFIEEKNPIAAQRIANELLIGVEKLKVFPEIGLMVDRAPQPELIRDLFIGRYTIRYLIGENEIVVLRMWHGKEIEKDL
ncbi:MAG: type II toxin-antitoxin system RelE/ParE family toxin [Proteobacteria bacterium]|nr:type II toxin-antitoxin system RelE/ParE family toxin [Pseudomonadota bacterium]